MHTQKNLGISSANYGKSKETNVLKASMVHWIYF